MRKTVLSLTDPEAQENNVSGNKAATLAKMTAAGLPVPPGFIVPTEVFADSLRGSMFEIDESLGALRDSDLDAIKDISNRAQQIVLGAVLNNGVVSAVATAYQGVGQGAVSVRSSAPAEDLPDASFAGQYDSFLNVLSLDQVIDRIVRVWASLYSPWAIAYRRRWSSTVESCVRGSMSC